MGRLVLGAVAISGVTAVLVAAHAAPVAHPATAASDTITVQMIGSSSGYTFQPSTAQIKVGQAVKFVMVSGGPHNVTFDPQDIPDGAAAALAQDMPNQQAKLTGPLVTNPNDSYVIVFKGVKPGAYKYYCLPHQSLGMQGTINIQ